MTASFIQQLKVLIWRNILLKKRTKKQLIQEVFYPIYFIGILAMIKALSKPSTQPAIDGFPVNSLKQFNMSESIFVTPNTTEVRSIMADVGTMAGIQSEYFNDVESMESEYKLDPKRVGGGLIFSYQTASVMTYALRLDYKVMSGRDLFTPALSSSDCRNDVNGTSSTQCRANNFLTSGFVWLQNLVETALIKNNLSSSLEVPDVSVQLMPKGPYTSDISYIQTVSAIYFVFAYGFFVNFLTTNIVAEKEKKIRVGMKMMGLHDAAFWLSWGIVYAVIILLVTLVVVVIAYAADFFQNSNIFIFFLILYLYGLSVINLSFMISPFFNKAKTAGFIASFFTLIASTLYFVVSETRTVTPDGYSYSISPAGRYALCLLSPVALSLAVDQGFFLSVAKGGMTFDTINLGDFPLSGPIIMLAVDIVLYGLLAFYLDRVIPGEYGVRYKPWFFLLPSFWIGGKRKSGDLTSLIDNKHLSINGEEKDSDIEMVSPDIENKAALRIFNIRKTFKNSDKEDVHAVDGISLDIYEGQITGLLGHNGAGKTTLINMLCGLTPPSEGSAIINNLDITDNNDLEKIRATAGICPQHNILYEDLSCREHLVVFAGIKGVQPNLVKSEIERSLSEVGLTEQAEVYSKDLSGGQKRKLSVAIALIGDPKIIILDEPTAGMDPYSRRQLWSLLKKSKEGKLILLTTHFMDEADILADRKAIISKGQLRCCGSSLFLKSKFGIGYHLNMVVDPEACKVREITQILKQNIDGVELQRSHGKELSYTVPMTEIEKFSGMFNALETTNGTGKTTADNLGIQSYGVSMTSLEEVFLKLGSIEESDSKDVKKDNLAALSDTSVVISNDAEDLTSKSPLNLNKGKELRSQRIKALLWLRLLIAIRNRVGFVFQMVIPIVLVVTSVVLYKVNQKTVSDKPEPFQIQPVYAQSLFLPSNSPKFLIFDSINSSDTQSLVNNFQTSVYVDELSNSSTNLMSIAPHWIGINILDYVPSTNLSYTCLYNDTAIYSLPVIINMMSNALLGTPNGIQVYNLPWPRLDNKPPYDGNTFTTILILGLAFNILLAGFASNVVLDRQFKTRSQLRVTGITFDMYWGTTFVFDIAIFSIPAIICIVFFLAMQIPSLTPAGAIVALILLFIFFIPANLMLSYCFSFAFNQYESCIAVLPTVFILAGMLPYVTVSVVDMVTQGTGGIIVHYIFCVIDPPYVIFGGLYFIDRIMRLASYRGLEDEIVFGDYFGGDGHIIFPILVPILHFIGLYYLVKILDIRSNGGNVSDICKRGDINKVVPEDNNDVVEDEDNDVRAEREKVAQFDSQPNRTDAVAYVSNLRKEFKKRGKSEFKMNECKSVRTDDEIKVAVRNATLSVLPGEVFGLLGPNGAGKTTLMNMIIAEVGATRGKVILNGHNINSNISEAFQGLGYCPQHDALWQTITLNEHLELYAAIKGVPKDKIAPLIDFYVDNLKVGEHAKKHSKKLSGGTKRKLSYVMSIMANSNVVLLDEPSTGMDPESKRFLWDTISSSFTSTDKGAILTTHYMEEADALCDRLAIMVNGKIECLGPSQHLKDKFGSGYILEIKLHSQINDIEKKMDEFEAHIKTCFPNATSAEKFGDRGLFKVPKADVKSLAEAFSFLETAKQTRDVEEYSFSQSSLEQVFLEFAKRQKDEEEEKNDKKKLERQRSGRLDVDV